MPLNQRDGCHDGCTPTPVGGVVYTVLSDFGLQDPYAANRHRGSEGIVRDVRVSLDRRSSYPRLVPALGIAAALLSCLWIVERRSRVTPLVSSTARGRGPSHAEVSLDSTYHAGVFQVLQLGSCRKNGLAPIRDAGDCQDAARALKLRLNDTNLRTTDLADVPEGCYYCHNFVDGTYTLWLGKSKDSRGNGAETSEPTKTRQPVCMDKVGTFYSHAPASPSSNSSSFNCNEGFSEWKTKWTEAQKRWCCKAKARGCPAAPTTSADSSRSHAAANAPFQATGPAKFWEVVSRGGVVVRRSECTGCRAIDTKAPYEVVRGREHGDWLQLEGEPGYVLLRRGSMSFLREAKPFYLVRVVAGRCEQFGRVPIHDIEMCNAAAKALHLPATSATSTSKVGRPEGCYYFEHNGEVTLWMSTNPDNRGHGAKIAPGSSRLPLCALRPEASTAAAPAAPTPAAPPPPPSTAAPTVAPKAPAEVASVVHTSAAPVRSTTRARAAKSDVTIFMTVQNIEYNRLLDTPNVATMIVSAVKRSVLFMVDDPSIGEDHVQVILSSGSVEVAATIKPPVGEASRLRSKLSSRAPYACKALAADLGSVKAISAVSTGKISIGDITVTESPRAGFLTTTTTLTTTSTTTITTSTRTSTSTRTATSTSSSTTATATGTTTTSTATSLTSTSTSSTSSTVSSSSTTTTGTTVPTSTTRTTTTGSTTAHPTTSTKALALADDSLHWDCSGNDVDVHRWSHIRRQWCCLHHNRGCFDCLAGHSHWEVGWAADKKKWCCKAAGVGCGYDCSQGPWSTDRKVWCCVHKNIGCEDPAAPEPHHTPALEPGDSLTGDTDLRAREGQARGEGHVIWNCYDKSQDMWPDVKQAWCCRHRNEGCKAKPFDCRAELKTWQVSWSQQKVDWCCRFEQLGCPLYDCGVGLANAETSWSEGKKAWCCRTQQLGCPKPYNCNDGTENYFVHWSEDKRKWCCTHEKRGCLEPYHCHTSTDLWESGWSSRKKAWCCEHMKVCPRLWDCHTGASNWEVEWGKEQQGWCCRHERIGCGYECVLPSATWSFLERLWCCQNRGIECNTDAKDQFRAG